MDIHRARFVPYQSSAINALAFSHSEPDNDHDDPADLRLALGRANGNIEIWNPNGGLWLQEKVFYGGKDRSVEGLAWIQEQGDRDEHGTIRSGKLRLFSIGYSSSVTEWDLATGLPARHSSGNNSEVWCFAPQPSARISNNAHGNTVNSNRQDLVAGCADGSLIILSTADNDLAFDRFLHRSSTKKARVLSVTYKDRHVVLAGFADSTIRVFDVQKSTVLRNISLGSAGLGGPKEILVWKVKCLANGDFVSGDSTGDIRIYNGKNYSQIQRIRGHEADVLDLAVSRDGHKIFSGGLDRRTCLYTYNKKNAKATGGQSWWRKVSHQRYHEHDVKAMTTFEGNKLNVVVSGGIDTQPIVVPLQEFGRELSRSLPALPSAPPLVSASQARLAVSWWNSEIRIWRVKNQQDTVERPKVIARLALKGDENITSVSITQDGALLAVATMGEVRLFQITQARTLSDAPVRVRKLDMPTRIGGRLVCFSRDGKWLAIITARDEIRMARTIRSQEPANRPHVVPQLLRLSRLPRRDIQSNQHSSDAPLGQYTRTVTHAAFSDDGTIFAVADLAGYVDTWVLEGHEDSTAPELDIGDSLSLTSSASSSDAEESGEEEDAYKKHIMILGQRWIRNPSAHLLPRLDSIPLVLSFQPVSDEHDAPQPNGNPAVHPTRHNPHPHARYRADTEHHLLVVTAGHRLYHFQVLAGRLSDWSRRNPPHVYPSKFKMLDNPAKGCVWDVVDDSQRLWLYGEKWVFMFDLSRDMALQESTSKKRKRDMEMDISKKSSSGAGNAVPKKELPITKIRKTKSGKGDDSASWIDLSATSEEAHIDDDKEDGREALAKLRRSAATDERANAESGQDGGLDGDSQGMLDWEGSNEGWWHTFKYRPILGIVPIGKEKRPVEVVLVERPLWDLDLPPRFVGSHE